MPLAASHRLAVAVVVILGGLLDSCSVVTARPFLAAF